MATVIDDAVNSTNISSLVADLVEGRRLDARFNRVDQETRISGITHLHEMQRYDYQKFNLMVLNSVANDRFGQGLAKDILDERSAEAQPQQQTYNDPNYRSGALAPGRAASITVPAGGGTVQIGG